MQQWHASGHGMRLVRVGLHIPKVFHLRPRPGCKVRGRDIPTTWRPPRLRFLQTGLGFRDFSSFSRHLSDADFAAARQWYKSFDPSKTLKDIGEVSYSRSSGPGGQNVNKVNSKAQLRVPIEQLLPLTPPVVHQGIRSSRYYAEKTSSLLIQSDDSRKQSANRDACYRKLTDLLVKIYQDTVPGETSEDQKEKVKELKELENEARLQRKKVRSNKKASRAKSLGD